MRTIGVGGGASPKATSLTRASGERSSVDHGGSRTRSNLTEAAPNRRSRSSISTRIVCSAGHPAKVGRSATRTAWPSISTAPITPSSTRERTGISGSGIVPSSNQTCSSERAVVGWVTSSPLALRLEAGDGLHLGQQGLEVGGVDLAPGFVGQNLPRDRQPTFDQEVHRRRLPLGRKRR